MTRINVHMYMSPFTHETRMLRITRSLAESKVFERILVVAALRTEGTMEHEILDNVRAVWRVPTVVRRANLVGKVFNTLEWSVRVFWRLKREPMDCINAHALSVLPLAVLLKVMKKCRLVYDAHEIETETAGVRGVRQYFSKRVERFLMPQVDMVSLTSEGHAEWYRHEYGIDNVRVVRNYPYRREVSAPKTNLLRLRFGLDQQQILFLYQGIIAKPRGIDLILDVFSRQPKDRHIVFMGFGPNTERVKLFERDHANIHYHPAVAPEHVAKYTCDADVGIHMMDDSCINHLYALPNKPMEYLNAGIPAIVSDLPEMGRLIRDSGSGWVVPVNDGNALSQLVQSLDRAGIAEKAAFARAWSEKNTWELEELKVVDMYRDLGFIGIRS
jgi:glycosyltransferase involved in cell wall biosynthesis